MAKRRDADEQAGRISEALWDVLSTSGPQGLTLRAVAERAGCTTGLVLHRFPDKRALLLHARDLLHARTAEHTEAVEAAASDPVYAVRAVLTQALSLTPTTQQEARVWLGYLAAALGDDELAERHRAGNDVFVARMRRLIAAARPDWSESRSVSTATALIGLVEGLNVLSTADLDRYSPEAQLAALERALQAFGLAREEAPQ
ncbi:TetR/AcrR family transcriptional regulator [Plantibacter sp. YIM 135347]|uniref:TetR/AcrR family transcriptional regulator n=1 Tax=Plantibacter sp. YIM 135347 TaxID=3423919 RepID=UPI003D32C7FB